MSCAINDNKNDTEMPIMYQESTFQNNFKKWDRKQTKDIVGIKTPFNILSYFKS